MKVCLYARVSTQEQAGSGVSLDAQVAKLRAYAELFDLEVVDVIVDAGESAKSLNRPGIQRVLSMLATGAADGVCVTKLDRLTRSVVDWQTLIDGYFSEKAGKQLFSVADSIDTRTASGRMILGILMVVSQAERELIAERTRDALRFKVSQGEKVGRLPFGYSRHGKGLVPEPSEQATIAVMRELRASGFTLQKIAETLTERGVANKKGVVRWSNQSIRYILQQGKATAV